MCIYDTKGGNYPQKGIVMSEHSHQSYNVYTEYGKSLRQNRAHLRITGEDVLPCVEYDIGTDMSMIEHESGTHLDATASPRSTEESNIKNMSQEDQHTSPFPVRNSPVYLSEIPSVQSRPRRTVRKPRRLIEDPV